jgi:hypothetical protein
VGWTNDEYAPPRVTPDSMHDLLKQALRRRTGGREGVNTRLVNPLRTAGIHEVSQILGHDASRFMSPKDLFRARPELDTPMVARAFAALRKLLEVDALGNPPTWFRLS